MSDTEITTTTFHYDRDKHWKFKHVIALQKKTVKKVCSELIDFFLEDFDDLRLYEKIPQFAKVIEKNEFLEWTEFKRRFGLDELQDYGQYTPRKKNKSI